MRYYKVTFKDGRSSVTVRAQGFVWDALLLAFYDDASVGALAAFDASSVESVIQEAQPAAGVQAT